MSLPLGSEQSIYHLILKEKIESFKSQKNKSDTLEEYTHKPRYSPCPQS